MVSDRVRVLELERWPAPPQAAASTVLSDLNRIIYLLHELLEGDTDG